MIFNQGLAIVLLVFNINNTFKDISAPQHSISTLCINNNFFLTHLTMMQASGGIDFCIACTILRTIFLFKWWLLWVSSRGLLNLLIVRSIVVYIVWFEMIGVCFPQPQRTRWLLSIQLMMPMITIVLMESYWWKVWQLLTKCTCHNESIRENWVTKNTW